MTKVKTSEEIETVKQAAEISREAMQAALAKIKPGATKKDLNDAAAKVILERGAKEGFKTVDNYGFATCVTVNDEVVHGIPNADVLNEGDIVSIDLGAQLGGLHTDCSTTVGVGKIAPDAQKFLDVGKKALKLAIAEAQDGTHVGDISNAIQEVVEKAGYSVVKELTGHGIGTKLHEEPMIPGVGKRNSGPILKSGQTVAIEVIYAMGGDEIVYKNDDGWTISSADKSLTGLFEETILITNGEPIVLTGIN